MKTTITNKVTDEEMQRRADSDGARLSETMTDLGVAALSAVVLDDSLDYEEVLRSLQFMRKVKFNRNFDLISRRNIDKHFQRHGIETEYGKDDA